MAPLAHYFWVIPVACAVAAAAFAGAGALRVLGPQRELTHKLAAVQASPLLKLDPQRVRGSMERIQADVAAVGPLTERAKAALDGILTDLRALRLPEAVMAIRVAGAAVRALLGRA